MDTAETSRNAHTLWQHAPRAGKMRPSVCLGRVTGLCKLKTDEAGVWLIHKNHTRHRWHLVFTAVPGAAGTLRTRGPRGKERWVTQRESKKMGRGKTKHLAPKSRWKAHESTWREDNPKPSFIYRSCSGPAVSVLALCVFSGQISSCQANTHQVPTLLNRA